MNDSHFTPATFAFLTDLAANNNRPWFMENKARYERDLKEPALRFISDFGPHLGKISSRFRADPRANGGSMFRIYRDTRFSKDKSPYKTYTGIQFRHEAGKDAHAPGFYLHIQPGSCFAGCGVWHPDGPALARIRQSIDENPAAWKRASRGKRFRGTFELSGDSLIRAPKGYDPSAPADRRPAAEGLHRHHPPRSGRSDGAGLHGHLRATLPRRGCLPALAVQGARRAVLTRGSRGR